MCCGVQQALTNQPSHYCLCVLLLCRKSKIYWLNKRNAKHPPIRTHNKHSQHEPVQAGHRTLPTSARWLQPKLKNVPSKVMPGMQTTANHHLLGTGSIPVGCFIVNEVLSNDEVIDQHECDATSIGMYNATSNGMCKCRVSTSGGWMASSKGTMYRIARLSLASCTGR